MANSKWAKDMIKGGMTNDAETREEMEEILFDPQTSGGLLVSIEKSDAEQCLEELKALGLPCAIVGEVTEKREKKIEVR